MSNMGRLWRTWRARQGDRQIAAQFTERDLRDLGLTRGGLYRELAGPAASPKHARHSAGLRAIGQVASSGALVQ